jgi:proline iminopeptidase
MKRARAALRWLGSSLCRPFEDDFRSGCSPERRFARRRVFGRIEEFSSMKPCGRRTSAERTRAPPRSPRAGKLGWTASVWFAKLPAMPIDRRTLYPSIESFDDGMLEVSPLHTIYYEQSGNPRGKPVVFLHGGPGGGTSPTQRRFFDPERYRVILFDQRGCGLSTPHACLEENTTWDLVDDIERLRRHLEIDAWQVFGGSWGSTLALAYAQKFPHRVRELVLRGIFLLRREELRWFYQDGASAIFPEVWEAYKAVIPKAEQGDFLTAYYRRLTDDNPEIRQEAARAWSTWEGSTSFLYTSPENIKSVAEDAFSLAFARIECHYFVNGGFFERENQLLEDVDKIRDIPTVIVQGRYDVVCPMQTAWALHKAWPEADFRIVPTAGHSSFEPGIIDELVRATDSFARRTSAAR